MKDRDSLRSKILSILLIALFFTALYLIRGGIFESSGYLAGEENLLDPKIYVQIEGEQSEVYAFPLQEGGGIRLRDVLKRSGNDITFFKGDGDAIIKSGSRVAIRPDKSIETGHMDGEKLILFDIPIDINRAQVKDLEALPGIGEALAARIVETRNILGGFRSIEGLKKVRGIGGKKLKEIADLVKAGE